MLEYKLQVPATLLVLFLASDVAAFCRTKTCQDDGTSESGCRRTSRGCISEGLTLTYESPCLTFAVSRTGVNGAGLTPLEFHAIVEQAFERWQTVDCGRGETPGVFVQSAGLVTADDNFSCSVVSENIAVWRLEDAWQLSADALGNTNPQFIERTAEVFDADVQLNIEKILKDVPEEDLRAALLTIATHEAGHVLGLAHSDDPDAVMAAEYKYSDGKLVEREFTTDDIDGICEVWPPEGMPNRCPKATVPEGALDAQGCEQARDALEASAAVPEGGCDFDGGGGPTSSSRWTLVGGFLAVGLMLRRVSGRRPSR